MVYEYEKENVRKLTSYNVLSGGANITKPINELQEVYRKAKAWGTLKEQLAYTYQQDKKGNGSAIDMKVLFKEMDKLDGTNEFSNLLSDMEDE